MHQKDFTSDLINYIKQHTLVGRRDIAKKFNIHAGARIHLKQLLKKLVEDKILLKKGKFYQSCEAPPLTSKKKRVRQSEKTTLLSKERILGVIQRTKTSISLSPTNRKDHRSFFVNHTSDAKHGDLVEAEVIYSRKKNQEARIIQIFGLHETLSPSFIAIKTHGLPDLFSKEALTQANEAQVPSLENRVDLRHLPLVTIDDEDARDFDDAIYAVPDDDKSNKGGWVIWVAIADVSYYVPPHTPLDHEAYERGNSVYLPDKVIPMLPEHLSNYICSLKPHEDRGCFAVHMRITPQGHLLDFKFMRGLMKSAARLTYNEVQKALDQEPTVYEADFVKHIIHPLYEAYGVLRQARTTRGALDIERPEQRIYLDSHQQVHRIADRPRYKSHEIVEEIMILANVAAGLFLTQHTKPSLFRIHDEPDAEKVNDLWDYLKSFKFNLQGSPKPSAFNSIMEKSKNTPYAHAIQELILRTQARAVYSPDNIGHYGLGLPHYAHFTSPIRRYADIVVHRAILNSLDEKNIYSYDKKILEDMGDHVSFTERQAAKAERDTIERYITLYLKDKINHTFECRITGVVSFGLFVELLTYGIQGFIPFKNLQPLDYYRYDRKNHALVGRRQGQIFTLGNIIQARLKEADIISSSLTLSMDSSHSQSVKKSPKRDLARNLEKKPLKKRLKRKSS